MEGVGSSVDSVDNLEVVSIGSCVGLSVRSEVVGPVITDPGYSEEGLLDVGTFVNSVVSSVSNCEVVLLGVDSAGFSIVELVLAGFVGFGISEDSLEFSDCHCNVVVSILDSAGLSVEGLIVGFVGG